MNWPNRLGIFLLELLIYTTWQMKSNSQKFHKETTEIYSNLILIYISTKLINQSIEWNQFYHSIFVKTLRIQSEIEFALQCQYIRPSMNYVHNFGECVLYPREIRFPFTISIFSDCKLCSGWRSGAYSSPINIFVKRHRTAGGVQIWFRYPLEKHAGKFVGNAYKFPRSNTNPWESMTPPQRF